MPNSLSLLLLTAAHITVFGAPLPHGGGSTSSSGAHSGSSSSSSSSGKSTSSTSSSSKSTSTKSTAAAVGGTTIISTTKTRKCSDQENCTGKLNKTQLIIVIVVVAVIVIHAGVLISVIIMKRRGSVGGFSRGIEEREPWWKRVLPGKGKKAAEEKLVEMVIEHNPKAVGEAAGYVNAVEAKERRAARTGLGPPKAVVKGGGESGRSSLTLGREGEAVKVREGV